MTTDKQIKALAELDGIVGQWQGLGYVLLGAEWREVPQHLTSYDAIIPLIQKQDKGIQLDVWDRVSMFKFIPAQLAEALLRATGKWEDGQ